MYFVKAPLIHYITTILLLHFVERWDVYSGTNKVNEAVLWFRLPGVWDFPLFELVVLLRDYICCIYMYFMLPWCFIFVYSCYFSSLTVSPALICLCSAVPLCVHVLLQV